MTNNSIIDKILNDIDLNDIDLNDIDLNDIDLNDINLNDNDLNDINLNDNDFEEIIFDKPIKTDRKINVNKINELFEWVIINDNWKNKLLTDKFYIYDSIDKNLCNIETIIIKIAKVKNIKQRIKKYINEISYQDFCKIVKSYQNEKHGNIKNIDNIKTRNNLIKILTNKEYILESDYTTLYILSEILQIDFIIFDNDNQEIIDLTNRKDNKNENFIIIYKETNKTNDDKIKTYSRLIGLKNDNNEIDYKFVRNKLPKKIDEILDKHIFFLSHAKNASKNLKKNNKKITIREIMKEIKNNIKMDLSDNDINYFMLILKNILEQDAYKKAIKSYKK